MKGVIYEIHNDFNSFSMIDVHQNATLTALLVTAQDSKTVIFVLVCQ